MKFYLAGPMTGKPDYNYQLFTDVCAELRKRELEILSPHEIKYPELDGKIGSLPYFEYVKGGLKLLLECDAIMLMTGWELSKGCLNEFYVAKSCDMQVFFYDINTSIVTTNWVSP